MIQTSAMGIRYEEFGTGMPFIALHGYTLDRRMSMGAFEPLFDENGRATIPPSAGAGKPFGGLSASSYRRIYPDSPFMGGSCDLAEASSDAMLSAFEAFVREVAPSGPFLLAGESYGGYIARALARSFPGRVAGMFMLCPLVVARRDERDIPEPGILMEEPGWDEGASAEDAAEYVDCAVIKSRYAFKRTQ